MPCHDREFIMRVLIYCNAMRSNSSQTNWAERWLIHKRKGGVSRRPCEPIGFTTAFRRSYSPLCNSSVNVGTYSIHVSPQRLLEVLRDGVPRIL